MARLMFLSRFRIGRGTSAHVRTRSYSASTTTSVAADTTLNFPFIQSPGSVRGFLFALSFLSPAHKTRGHKFEILISEVAATCGACLPGPSRRGRGGGRLGALVELPACNASSP